MVLFISVEILTEPRGVLLEKTIHGPLTETETFADLISQLFEHRGQETPEIKKINIYEKRTCDGTPAKHHLIPDPGMPLGILA